MKARKNQRKPAYARLAPKKFVYPAPRPEPEKRDAIAGVIAELQRQKRLRRGRKNGEVDEPNSEVFRHALARIKGERMRLKRTAASLRERLRRLQDQRSHLLQVMVSVANGATRADVEALSGGNGRRFP